MGASYWQWKQSLAHIIARVEVPTEEFGWLRAVYYDNGSYFKKAYIDEVTANGSQADDGIRRQMRRREW